MKFRSIKFKITFWYTCIIIIILGIVLGGTFFASEYYSETLIKDQLLDEVGDTCELLMDDFDDIFDDGIITYDDGVMISVYDDEYHLLTGVYPDSISIDVPFKNGEIQEVRDGSDNWFIYDLNIEAEDDIEVWVRGTSSFSPMVSLLQRFTLIFAIVFPPLVFLIAFVGYQMIKRSLRPIYTISQTVDEIISSSNLSVRLDEPKAKDEFSYLTNTFNHLLEHLEQQFLREQQFSSDAAHELRTPVSAILSHCEYCLDELELSTESRDELSVIRQKALQMSSLISTLLAIARAESGRYQPNFEEVDLEILAESVMEELAEKAAAKKICLELQNHMDSPVITADLSMFTRLFMNLIENGIKYGREDGSVIVSLSQESGKTILQFTDDGIGIPEESLDKIWNRFYQVDSSHASSGFGLGLFLVKHIVTLHNGSISVKSTVGKGTTFTISLPL